VTEPFTLDNAAKAWPAVVSKRQTSRFRLSAVFHTPLVYEHLDRAVQLVRQRYPWFMVRLGKGFFWYHLREDPKGFALVPDIRHPCTLAPEESPIGQVLVTVHGFHRILSIEASHMITDGAGLREIFQTLVSCYCALKVGSDLRKLEWGKVRSPLDTPKPDEWVDEFLNHDLEGIPGPEVPSKALHLPVRPLPPNQYRVVHGIIPLDTLKERARTRGVKVGEYLGAAVLFAFQSCILEVPKAARRRLVRRPLRLLIPVDLRKLYGSNTLRNFLLGLGVDIDVRLGVYSFEEILRRVHHTQQTELDEKYLRRQLSRNVRGEQRLAIRLVPLFLKDLFLGIVFRDLGEVRHTASFSNLGQINLAPGTEHLVDHMALVPPPGSLSRINVTALSFGNTLCLTVGKTTRYRRFDYHLFRFLADQILGVRMWTN